METTSTIGTLKNNVWNFKTEAGDLLIDAMAHVKDLLEKHSDAKIYIGCDSGNAKTVTTYVTVIAIRYGARGVHFIYDRQRVKKIRDKYSRLWKEVEYTAELGEYLQSHKIPIYAVELDFNKDHKSGSNFVLGSGVGYLLGLGYKNVIVKPDVQVAVKAADHIVRR